MFDHRLGLALGKSLLEVHALPYPEYKSWQLYYALEPWGWQNEEYGIGALLSMLFNLKRGKQRAKNPAAFMRNMEAELLKQLNAPDVEDLPLEQRKKTIIGLAKQAFGIK